MNLVSFSIRTKGLHNFTRRLWTVFTRFGFTEVRIRRALDALLETLQAYGTAPTFFIPAVVLRRHPELITKVSYSGAEIGIHGYVHNDYRLLSEREQYEQTQRAISVFRSTRLPYQGFRNPYLGWTEESLRVFNELGFTYESNEAVIHDVIDLESLAPIIRSGYEKSLALFQAIPPSTYTLRPHLEDTLLRIPTSIPDDEMLFDRLRITNPYEIGQIWCRTMKGVYDYGGVFALNLHPERGVHCRKALDTLLKYARDLSRGVWLARLDEIAQWWKERSRFSLSIAPLSAGCWLVEADCSPRATLFARHLTVDYQLPTALSSKGTDLVCGHRCIVQATKCPCLALSPQTPMPVKDFLLEQGYPVVHCSQEEADKYGLFLDIPEGLGETRSEQLQRRSMLLQRIEQAEIPLLYFGAWPDNNHAALSISGDIDSVTIQDFFLRILEVYRSKEA